MRDQLAINDGRRLACRARVQQFGTRPISSSCRERTVCLVDVAGADGGQLADHVWFPVGKRLAALDLRRGDVLTFTATVRAYRKKRTRRPDGSCTPGVLDYKLAAPAQLCKVAAAEGGPDHDSAE